MLWFHLFTWGQIYSHKPRSHFLMDINPRIFITLIGLVTIRWGLNSSSFNPIAKHANKKLARNIIIHRSCFFRTLNFVSLCCICRIHLYTGVFHRSEIIEPRWSCWIYSWCSGLISLSHMFACHCHSLILFVYDNGQVRGYVGVCPFRQLVFSDDYLSGYEWGWWP